MFVTKKDGSREVLSVQEIHLACLDGIHGVVAEEDEAAYVSDLEMSAHLQFYDGIPTSKIQTVLVKTAGDKISAESPEWSKIASRLLMRKIDREVAHRSLTSLSPLLGFDPEKEFDVDLLDREVARTQEDVNHDFEYLGLQILHDRYLLRDDSGRLVETPAMFYMRVSAGVALVEKDVEERTSWALKFYGMISRKKFSPATSTLFNSGLKVPQLSSCFLLSMEDSLEGIFSSLQEAATYSKHSGGIGMDMTLIRSRGSLVHSTKGKSSGVIPYIKLLEETVRGFNQGGKRPGSAAVYLEPWHADIRSFLDIRNNSGDERMRAHDIFPALWIPDLFMKQVQARGDWYLFNPGDHPELHDLFGDLFESHYWKLVEAGEYVEKVDALELWKVIIQKAFETGTYWPCFKDTVNLRYAQRLTGPVRSSNLCTEITLRSSQHDGVSAVCNLASLNLSRISDSELKDVVRIAVRFLDNVLDVGVLPHERGRNFNGGDRAVGLGVMGYAEWLYQGGTSFDSDEHLRRADELFEKISHHAIFASSELARERGKYRLFEESSWARGEMPHDTHRGPSKDWEPRMDWTSLRKKVMIDGMRNSCLLAIAPTSTISDIAGTTPCVELPDHQVTIRENLSGFVRAPNPLLRYKSDVETFLEVPMERVVEAAAIRQRWLDQSQSLNLKVKSRPQLGAHISDLYFQAWRQGVKTTYYLKTLSAELSGVCAIGNRECESCQ